MLVPGKYAGGPGQVGEFIRNSHEGLVPSRHPAYDLQQCDLHVLGRRETFRVKGLQGILFVTFRILGISSKMAEGGRAGAFDEGIDARGLFVL